MNEYLSRFLELYEPDPDGWGWEVRARRELLSHVYEGPEWRRYMDATVRAFAMRDEWCRRYAWAVPSPEAIDRIANLSPIVEIGAGTGYWASLLRERGARVHAYDASPRRNAWTSGSHFPVGRGTPRKLRRGDDRGRPAYRDWTLLVSWAPYESAMGYDALRLHPGPRAVIVGEGPGGCTGDCRMDALLGREGFCFSSDRGDHACQHVRPRWRSVGELAIPQYPGMHDYVELFERA